MLIKFPIISACKPSQAVLTARLETHYMAIASGPTSPVLARPFLTMLFCFVHAQF